MHMHPNRVRKPSQRILVNTAFSTFTNTAENPMLLDEEDNHHSPVINPKTAEKQVLRVRKKINENPGLSASMECDVFMEILIMANDEECDGERGGQISLDGCRYEEKDPPSSKRKSFRAFIIMLSKVNNRHLN
ncbi:hypothetical protein L6452_37497 [Arctium lappa]|uniref:Uncharacterized protein n=1 Tax=Arctium lappa TaxID=4217 RepID=A0ACB8Y349_ARCLA|nr:hypothetical protein L6452_37497 [Arctium lappa]